MTSWQKRLLLSAVLVTATVSIASAETSKLDARARTALAGAQKGLIPQLIENRAAVSETGDLDVFITGNVSRAELEAAGAIIRTELPGLFTAYIPIDAIDAVTALAGVASIQGAAPVYETNNVSIPTTLASAQRGVGPTFTGANGAGVLVGDVDSGIDHQHPDFDDNLGNTRLVSIWDQTNAAGPNPGGFAYGTEWSSASINANTCTETDLASTHGTHVMGTAAGDGSATSAGSAAAYTYTGMAPMADLCMVKTNFQTTGVLDGVTYVFNRATALGKNAVCNLSLGSQFGPHDGTDPFESGISALTGPGRVVCVSAGNDRGLALHGEVFAAGAGTNATMSVTGSAAARLFAIDGYFEASENINVQITTPLGTVIGPITVGNMNAAYPGTLTTNGRVYVENGVFLTATGDKEVYIEVNVPNPTGGATMNGTWTFRFIPVALGAANGEVDMWRFFQSSGVAANFVTGNDPTTELVSQPGTANGVITVAAYVSRQNWTDCGGRSVTFTGTPAAGNLAQFSSPGPSRDGRQKPDVAAPGIAIGSSRSNDVSVNPACPGSVTTQLAGIPCMHYINSGTSMAAPHVTGAVALIMQKFGAVTPAQARAHLVSTAIVDGMTGGVWNNNWGVGKLRVDVTNPTALVTSPNGGEVLTIGTNANLTWNASDAILFGSGVTINLLLSRTGVGGPYSTIASGLANSGTFNWLVTGPATVDAWLKVEAIDPVTNQGTDVSDAQFTIAPIVVPVELALFMAASTENGVKVSWKFTDDSEFSKVSIERGSLSSGPFETLASPISSDENGASYIVDESVEGGKSYFYRINAVTRVGENAVFGPISAIAGRGVTRFDLAPVWPNPSNGLARVNFSVPRESLVKIYVIDIQGRQVTTLTDGSYSPGSYQVSWDGSSDDGGKAPSGIYFVHMTTPDGKDFSQRVTVSH